MRSTVRRHVPRLLRNVLNLVIAAGFAISGGLAPVLAATANGPASAQHASRSGMRLAQSVAPAPSPAVPTAPDAPVAPPPGDPSHEMPQIDGEATLPRDLSPWGMFMAADHIVKAVMIGLAFASVVSWTVWLAKSLELFGAKRRAQNGLRTLAQSRTLHDGIEKLRGRGGPVAAFARAAEAEIRLSADAPEKDGVKERVASRLERIEAAAGRRMNRGTGILATIGSTGPFVGLFGTVWGIMNSFIGISKAQTTNLAVVAPGIAEALLATALGLAAAIPAVVIFNVFSRSITGYRGLLGDGAAEVMRLVSRDLDRAPLIRPRGTHD